MKRFQQDTLKRLQQAIALPDIPPLPVPTTLILMMYRTKVRIAPSSESQGRFFVGRGTWYELKLNALYFFLLKNKYYVRYDKYPQLGSAICDSLGRVSRECFQSLLRDYCNGLFDAVRAHQSSGLICDRCRSSGVCHALLLLWICDKYGLLFFFFIIFLCIFFFSSFQQFISYRQRDGEAREARPYCCRSCAA